MWSCVADTKFIRDGRKFNLREGSLSSLAGHLIRADPPGPRPGTILAPLPCPRCPSWHRHTNLSIVAALWCPTRGQFGVLYAVELFSHLCYHHTCSWKWCAFSLISRLPLVSRPWWCLCECSHFQVYRWETHCSSAQTRPGGGPRLFVYVQAHPIFRLTTLGEWKY